MFSKEEMIEISLSVSSPVSLNDIASKYELDVRELRRNLEYLLREHYCHFRTKPFVIEFDPRNGYILRANSAIGRLTIENINVVILPKLNGLSIGKCLGLAQFTGGNLLTLNNQAIASACISENADYRSLDFFSLSLLDSVLTVKNNGFARKFIDVFGPSMKLRGDISFQETIVSGKSIHNPIINTIEPSFDILPNQILKNAVCLVCNKSSSTEIQKMAHTYLQFFDGVSDIDIDSESFNHIFRNFNLPRPDYEKSLSFAKAIIEGRFIGEGDEDTMLPSFSIDLDKLFESYCGYQLKKLISRDNYSVLLQNRFQHVSSPVMSDKMLIPDIIIQANGSSKRVIIDIKNKYTALKEDGNYSISNSDIYQITYYARSLNCKFCVLAYPSIKPRFQYPLKSSESEIAYSNKREIAVQKMTENAMFKIFKSDEITVIIYFIDLSGTLTNSKKSVASLGQLCVDILANNII